MNLDQEFVKYFDSYKKVHPIASSFHYIVIPIHWGITYVCGMASLQEEGKSLMKNLVNTPEDASRRLVLTYQLNPDSVWTLTAIENAPEQKVTLIWDGERGDWTNYSKFVIDDVRTYVRNRRGQTVEQVYQTEYIDDLVSFIRDANHQQAFKLREF
ncbi:hypothetical protein Ocin01_08578 [Orchesella cincta]|uniref:Uncharacterized protein n=1 Tax=Orchesella cincta TaxID=48709 RepID=A0A1D2MYH7_ORCCI|nr:hypothetical protein Ocin01_08578 [Orchesella cincta]